MAIITEDFAQLQERFGKILGRQPTADEIKELMADKDEIGLSYHDPLLVQLMAFKRERIALEELFRRHREDFERQMAEVRDHVLGETDRALVAKKAEVIQASEKQMQTELKRLLDMHRTVLTAEVKRSTENAVKEKFKETWIKEWQTEFTKDWKEQIDPAYTKLRDLLENARTVNWLWMITSLLLSFIAGIGLTMWWATKRTLPPADPPIPIAPVKKPGPISK
jgi:hypothetical protein